MEQYRAVILCPRQIKLAMCYNACFKLNFVNILWD